MSNFARLKNSETGRSGCTHFLPPHRMVISSAKNNPFRDMRSILYKEDSIWLLHTRAPAACARRAPRRQLQRGGVRGYQPCLRQRQRQKLPGGSPGLLPGGGPAGDRSCCSLKLKEVEVENVYMDVEPIPFNKGFYTVDLTFFFSARFEAQLPDGSLVTVCGVTTFTRKMILYGSEGDVKCSAPTRTAPTRTTACPGSACRSAAVALGSRVIDCGSGFAAPAAAIQTVIPAAVIPAVIRTAAATATLAAALAAALAAIPAACRTL